MTTMRSSRNELSMQYDIAPGMNSLGIQSSQDTQPNYLWISGHDLNDLYVRNVEIGKRQQINPKTITREHDEDESDGFAAVIFSNVVDLPKIKMDIIRKGEYVFFSIENKSISLRPVKFRFVNSLSQAIQEEIRDALSARTPTDAEADAWRLGDPQRCYVPLGSWHGSECPVCQSWVWAHEPHESVLCSECFSLGLKKPFE